MVIGLQRVAISITGTSTSYFVGTNSQHLVEVFTSVGFVIVTFIDLEFVLFRSYWFYLILSTKIWWSVYNSIVPIIIIVKWFYPSTAYDNTIYFIVGTAIETDFHVVDFPMSKWCSTDNKILIQAMLVVTTDSSVQICSQNFINTDINRKSFLLII